VANLLLGGVAIVLCYRVAQEAGAGRIGSLLSAAIWALYVPTAVYGVYLAKGKSDGAADAGRDLVRAAIGKTPSAKVAAGCGVLFGLLALTGNAALSLASVVLLALFVAPGAARHRNPAVGAIFVAALAVSAPWMIRNWSVLGAPVMNTNGDSIFILAIIPQPMVFCVDRRYASWFHLARTAQGRRGAGGRNLEARGRFLDRGTSRGVFCAGPEKGRVFLGSAFS
jgi:hypothetical protein